jgi:hypothetical protein
VSGTRTVSLPTSPPHCCVSNSAVHPTLVRPAYKLTKSQAQLAYRMTTQRTQLNQDRRETNAGQRGTERGRNASKIRPEREQDSTGTRTRSDRNANKIRPEREQDPNGTRTRSERNANKIRPEREQIRMNRERSQDRHGFNNNSPQLTHRTRTSSIKIEHSPHATTTAETISIVSRGSPSPTLTKAASRLANQ